MIGHIRGRLIRKSPPALIVDVNGVGYELEAPMSTFYRLPEIGSEVERRLFRDLLRVTGIGPKIGLALLSGIDVDTFLRCVEAQDVDALTRIPGIGRKTAERLLIEMRDRIQALGQLRSASRPVDADAGARVEAYAALVALGYRPVEATRLLKSVESEGTGTEDLIRRALQAAAR